MAGSFIRVVLHRKDKESVATFVEMHEDMPAAMLDTNITVSLGNEVAGSAAVTVPLDLLTMMLKRVMDVAEAQSGLVVTAPKIILPS